jgi:7,8-dihydropterin-6-yl-methyl-4-(beta-D-ribofuranosyl)aminobenzene 5'-phosphate synthase
MKIQILFENAQAPAPLKSGWGFSCLIDGHTLFDTGSSGSRLIKNMEHLRVDFGAIKRVLISHNHWDHQGGLNAVLKKVKGADVWLGRKGFDARWERKIIKTGNRVLRPEAFTEVASFIYSTGEIDAVYKFHQMPEQSLVLRTDRGLTVITGCAHPGIVKILDSVYAHFRQRIYLVLGGFHLFGKRRSTLEGILEDFRRLGVEKVAPCHCTGETAQNLFQEAYTSNRIKLKIGDAISV